MFRVTDFFSDWCIHTALLALLQDIQQMFDSSKKISDVAIPQQLLIAYGFCGCELKKKFATSSDHACLITHSEKHRTIIQNTVKPSHNSTTHRAIIAESNAKNEMSDHITQNFDRKMKCRHSNQQQQHKHMRTQNCDSTIKHSHNQILHR